MKNFINKFKFTIIYVTSLLLLSIIFTLIEYFGGNYSLCTTLLSIINFILVFIYAFLSGLKTNVQGYKCGIRSFVKILIILLTINIITLSTISFKTIIYYFIILTLSISGSILGKNKQKSCLK